MRRYTFATVENILRNFPVICKLLSDREQYLKALLCVDSFNNSSVARFSDAARKASSQEALLDAKNRDVEYCELLTIYENISEGLEKLPEINFNVITLAYIKKLLDAEIAIEMEKSERQIQRLRIVGVVKMIEPCLKVHVFYNRCIKRYDDECYEIMITLKKSENKKIPA